MLVKKMFLLTFMLSASIDVCGQSNYPIAEKINTNSTKFNSIQFGLELPQSIEIESIDSSSFTSAFDGKRYHQVSKRFRGDFFGYESQYFVLELDTKVHLMHVTMSRIGKRRANKLKRKLTEIFGEFDYKKFDGSSEKQQVFFKDKVYLSAICWLLYDIENRELLFQIGDRFFTERLTISPIDNE